MSSFLVFILGWAVATTVSFAADIEITEVAWMGTVESQFGEWIELYNKSSADISLDGWKLYEGGGSTPLFSLSKTIPSGGYLIVERTTPSMPDPLPDISDEAGSFGGSGLSNTGEDMVLKDNAGTTVVNLPFQSGWPAGDAETKQTMQKADGAWITASPTPKAATSGTVKDDESSEEAGENIRTTKNKNEERLAWEPGITFSSPKQAFVGVPVKIAATVTEKTGMTVVGSFFWNTGAGQVVEQKFLEPITVAYEYPGDYVVTLAYSPHANAPEPELVGQFSLTVTTPSFVLERGDMRTVFVKNSSNTSLDLYQWQLAYGGSRYAFPRYSIVKPGNRLAVPAAVFGTASFLTLPALINPSGTFIGTPLPVSEKGSVSTVQAVRTAATPKIETAATKTTIESSLFAAAAGTNAAPKNNQRTWIIISLGALVAISVFLYLLLERFKAREE